jgi:hypothetical protein
MNVFFSKAIQFTTALSCGEPRVRSIGVRSQEVLVILPKRTLIKLDGYMRLLKPEVYL